MSLNNLRHSCAHLLAAAVLDLWPDTKLTIGPAIDDGFYYDFEFLSPISDKDLPKIEKRMKRIAPTWKSFEHKEVSADEARNIYTHNPYKLELVDEIDKKNETITLYTSGNFTDLCRGGHVEEPNKELKYFKLLSVAGAYWRGDEKNKMLTRIYGTCFPTQSELDDYLHLREEAKKRDHRKLGKELELFTIEDKVGPGLPLWLPKGNTIKDELQNWAKETEKEWGYQHVSTPHITKSNLYYTSGHLPYYKDDMYPPMQLDDKEDYYLKPMNCPHHHMIFNARQRSYRELPLRISEYGMCYRYEASGELFGLMRVRSLDINDAHIYTTEEQAVDEFVNVMRLHEFYYQSLGIKNYHLELALRDPEKTDKYHGDSDMWDKAESLMRQAVAKVDIPMVEEEGSAAFYGPKIDFIIHSSIGREFAISTNQIDLYMGGRFELTYVDNDGKETTPVIIHRAPLGSSERFIGFLIEHFGGAFPVWLHPEQVTILPVSEKHVEYAQLVSEKIKAHHQDTRITIDDMDERLGKKIRSAQQSKAPYMIIVGDKEMENKTINVRLRDETELGEQSIEEFAQHLTKIITTKSLDL